MGRPITMTHSPTADTKVANEDGLLLTAIMNNDKHYLVELLVQGCSPMGDPSKAESSTPLDLAISLQNLDMARILLRYGACMKLSSACPMNPTALHCAVLNRQKGLIRQLLSKKVDWSSSDGNGATVLHMVFELDETTDEPEHDDEMPRPKLPKMDFSLEQEIIEILTIFLNLGASVNAETSSGETPLFLALKKGMIEVAGFLIERGANVHVRDNMGNSLIHLLINDEVDEPDFEDEQDEDEEETEERFAQKNNATFIKWLLSKGVNANYKNARGESPMDLAIEYKLRDTLLVLMTHVNVHYTNEQAESWLHVFVKMYQSTPSSTSAAEFLTIADIHEVVRELLKRGAPVNGVDCYGQTLFHAAIHMKNPKLLKAIAERFVNVLACNSEGETVLHALVSRCIDDEPRNEDGYAEVARLLAAKGASANRKDKRGMSALHLAAQYKYAKIVRAFAETGADLSACTDDGASLLHVLAGRLPRPGDEAADVALVELALERGCDANLAKPRGGWTALHVAASSGNLAVARSLLVRGTAHVDCRNEEGYTPMHVAATKDGGERMVELLSRAGADVNALSRDTSSPLHLATKSAARGVIEALIQQGAKLDRCSREFGTALHLAALGHCPETLELLVRNGAPLDAASSRDGATPLHWLCSSPQPNLAVLERLLELGADANRADRRDGSTCMHLAVRRKQSERLFRLLAQHGAEVDARQAAGDTPLHEAARTCHCADENAISLLLELGARTRLKNLAGLTPLHCAVVSNCDAALYLLLQFGVDLDDMPANICSLLLASREMSGHLISHLAKLRAANLPAGDRCLKALSSCPSWSSEVERSLQSSHAGKACEREVEALKAHKIEDQVSLYKLLHMQPNLRYSYLKNKPLELAGLETKFPHYYGFVWRLCHEARQRKSLVEPALRAFKELTQIRLPDICAQWIFGFFDNECLKNIIDAAKTS